MYATICIINQFVSLSQPASRILFSAIVNSAKRHPKALIYGLLLPLIADPMLGTSQSEVINRVLKECLPPEMVLLFFRYVANCTQHSDATIGVSLKWEEHLMVLNFKTHLQL
jgi:hypothetical protein